MIARALVVLSLLANAAAAEETPRRSVIGANGMRYFMETNEYGFVLTSQYPLIREVAPPMEEGIETLYAGKDCDAFSPVLGTGTWWFGNGGVVIELERHDIGFSRLDPGYVGPNCRR